MSAILEKYVANIIKQIDGTKDQKADIYEELLIHLHLATEDGIKNGLNKEEAEKMAIDKFGNANTIGAEVQESMYPLRKILLLLLAIASLLYAYIVYAIALFSEGDAHFFWLITAVATSTLLLLIALRAFPTMDRKSTLNATLIAHIFVYLIGAFIPTILSIVAWLMIILSIILIYRTTITDFQYNDIKNQRAMKIAHFYNISIGLFISAATLFYLSVILIFAEEVERWMLYILIPFIIWVFTYYLQIILVQKNSLKFAVSIALIPLLIVVGIIGLYIKISFSY